MSSASDASTTVAPSTSLQQLTTSMSSSTNSLSLPVTTTSFSSSPNSTLSETFVAPVPSSSASLSLPVAPPVFVPTDSPDNGPSLATKIGIGVGAGVLILLIAIGTFLILRHRRKHNPSSAPQNAPEARVGALCSPDSGFDTKHPFTTSFDAAALELTQTKDARRSLKGRRNSYLATVSEEPGSRPLSLVPEGMDRSRTISPLASGPPGANLSTGHISLIQPDDRISSIAQSRMRLSLIPPGDRLSFAQPGDRSSVASDINASRQAALESLSGHNSPVSPIDVGSPTYSIKSQFPPSLPQRSPRRFSARGHELDMDSINVMPRTPETPPRSGSRSQVVDLYTGSSKYAP